MNEASSLSIVVDEELPSFSAVAPAPMLTRSLQDRYLSGRNDRYVNHRGELNGRFLSGNRRLNV
jgi:hypothetical protein